MVLNQVCLAVSITTELKTLGNLAPGSGHGAGDKDCDLQTKGLWKGAWVTVLNDFMELIFAGMLSCAADGLSFGEFCQLPACGWISNRKISFVKVPLQNCKPLALKVAVFSEISWLLAYWLFTACAFYVCQFFWGGFALGCEWNL